MRPTRPLGALLALALCVGSYVAGCAQGSQDTQSDVPVVSGLPDGSAGTTPQGSGSGDDGSAVVVDDATIPTDPDTGASDPDSAAGDDGSADATPPDDASGDAAPPPDAAPTDAASHDAGLDAAADASDAGAMSPILGLPSPSGQRCKDIGQDTDCPLFDTCLIDTPTGGRCEGCVACHGYRHSCTKSVDCAAPYQCYANVCSYICHLGGHDCGGGTTCVNVGNTKYGICQ
jgi:hypothetical protein